jgi:hypothetical protein
MHAVEQAQTSHISKQHVLSLQRYCRKIQAASVATVLLVRPWCAAQQFLKPGDAALHKYLGQYMSATAHAKEPKCPEILLLAKFIVMRREHAKSLKLPASLQKNPKEH